MFVVQVAMLLLHTVAVLLLVHTVPVVLCLHLLGVVLLHLLGVLGLKGPVTPPVEVVTLLVGLLCVLKMELLLVELLALIMALLLVFILIITLFERNRHKKYLGRYSIGDYFLTLNLVENYERFFHA